jgi:hypothetical protein
MQRPKTPNKTCDEYIALMGEQLGSEFYALFNETMWLIQRWNQYQILFATKPERVKLANDAAGLFFRLVQDSFFENTLLQLSRITDSPETGKKSNLTLRRLPSLMPDETAQRAVSELVEDAHRKTEFARDWRNRRIAHSDLTLVMNEGAEPLAPASCDDVNSALSTFGIVLNSVLKYFADSEILFEGFSAAGGAEALLYVMRDGIEAEKSRRQRLHDGEYSDADLGPRRAI